MAQIPLSVVVGGDVSGLRRAMGAAAAALGPLGVAAAGLAAGLAAVGVAAGKMAADFETQMVKIETLAGVSQEQIEAWGDQILELAPKLGRAPEELADALFFAASAGLSNAKSMDAVVQSAKAATAGLGDTDTIVRTVTAAMNAFGPQNLSAARAVDILAGTAKQGTFEVEELAGVIGMVIPFAAQAGVNFEQVGGTLAAMSLQGFSASQSATSLARILGTLQKPTAQAEEELGKIGLSMAKVREQVREKGLIAVLRTLNKRFDGNVESMNAVFGNSRAIRGVWALLGLQGGKLDKTMRGVRESSGLVDEAFQRQKETANGLWQEIQQHFRVLMINLGNTILPKVKTAMQFLVDVVRNLKGESVLARLPVRKLGERIQDVKSPADKTADALRAIAEVIGNIASAIQTAIGWIDRLDAKLEGLKDVGLSDILGGIGDFFRGGGLFGAITGAQHGFHGTVTRPTLFLAGEAGPERVDVTPRGQHAGITINIQNAFGFDDFERKVTKALGRAMARTGAA